LNDDNTPESSILDAIDETDKKSQPASLADIQKSEQKSNELDAEVGQTNQN
jgi:hypothetical protein